MWEKIQDKLDRKQKKYGRNCLLVNLRKNARYRRPGKKLSFDCTLYFIYIKAKRSQFAGSIRKITDPGELVKWDGGSREL